MPRFLHTCIVLVAACGSSTPPPPAPMAAPIDAAVAPIDAAAIDAAPVIAIVVDAAPEVPPDADERAAASAAIGLDLRALPVDPSSAQIDLFVLGQGDRIRELAPAEVGVEIRHVPGAGILIPVFRADTADLALRACRSTVKAYLAQAPTLPTSEDERAATLDVECARLTP